MNTVFQFVLKHGYSILFAALFAHQVGLPLPGPLFLLAAGALAAGGKLGLVTSFGLAVIACVLADWVWYEAGRRRGDKVLHFIHRLTPDPDFHDRRAKETFARYGLALLVVAKFIPGLDAVTPPLAGTSRTGRLRFFAFDALGASLYSGVYSALGFVFSHDLDRAVAYAGRVGAVLAGVTIAALFIYVVRKLVLRHRLASDLRRGRALLQAGIATVKRQVASTMTGDWPSLAYFPVPWPAMHMTCARHGTRTNRWGD
ncbi:MAG: DedA family protein [Acidobacteriia bacterium]|nr:DedA family protein [Terriglobia bacterium]